MKSKVQYLIFFIVIFIYIFFGYSVTISNDSVTNIDQIISLDLWSRSSHFSFHLLGIIFYLFFSKLIGLSATTSVEIMLAFISATAAISLYQITLKKYNNVNQAIITVIIYSFASGIFRFSCQVEYLILVPSLGLISLYYYSKEQYLIAGILFGFCLLTSPFAVLFIPMFFLFTSFKELFRKYNLVFALSLITVYFIINIFTYQETVSGHWSYGNEVNYYKGIFGEINFLRPASIYIYGYLRSFNIIILILPFVLYALYKTNKELFYVLIITILVHLPAAIPEARYGGYQLTAYPIIAIAAGFFSMNSFNKYKYAVLSILLVYSAINIFLVYSERSFFRDLKETYVHLSYDLEDNSVLIVYQAIKPIKNIYAPDLQVFDVLSDYQNKMEENTPGFTPVDLREILKNNETVYLLESGVSMPDDYLKLLVGQFTKNQGAKIKGFLLDKVLGINSSFQVEKLEGYSLDVYRLSRSKNK